MLLSEHLFSMMYCLDKFEYWIDKYNGNSSPSGKCLAFYSQLIQDIKRPAGHHHLHAYKMQRVAQNLCTVTCGYPTRKMGHLTQNLTPLWVRLSVGCHNSLKGRDVTLPIGALVFKVIFFWEKNKWDKLKKRDNVIPMNILVGCVQEDL